MSTTFHLAVCRDCRPVLPQPFFSKSERDEWADAHAAGTGHNVDRLTETR